MKKTRFSKPMALLLAILMVMSLLPMSALADNKSDITVYVTVSNQGLIASGSDSAHTVMADVPVTVASDEDGKATVDAVMQVAHSTYCTGGYATSSTAYGVSVTKLWGVDTTNNLFFVNGTGLTTDVGTDKVSDGSHLTASVNKDNTYYADWYSGFDKRAKTVSAGESFTLTLAGYYGMAYTPEDKTPAALSGITIGTFSDAGFVALSGKTTGADGTVSLSFNKAGTYIVSGSGTVSDEVTDYTATPNEEGVYPKTTVNCPIIAPVCVVTVQEPSIDVTVTDASDGTIPVGGYTYNVADTATALKVTPTASIEGGTYTYQWRYKTTVDAASSSTAAGTKTQQTYMPPTTQDGLRYYFCKVTYKLNGFSYIAESDCVPVKVLASAAQLPTISSQPVAGTYPVGASGVKAISVSAAVTDGGKLTYQWFLSRDGGEFQPVANITANNITPAETAPCMLQYYCRITNTVDSVSGASYSSSVKSDTVTVEFKSVADYGATWSGDGTQSSPYLIAAAADLQAVSSLCSNGMTFQDKYLKMTADIILPDDWMPIGTSANRFCGSFDGGGYLLTIPENGLPLLGYVRYASVSNLNIYGTKIASSGLVANYSVDSGISHTIDIINCTLKEGSSTLCSGFIGGYASGINTVNITNCTVEAGVVIGYDKAQSGIGSFGGAFNGYVTGCVSFATVYGVDNVGGIVGVKGQSMGACTVQDSAFHGAVDATGNYVGGIMGSGYSNATAPNSPCVSILNCFSDGTVHGANYVGGIFGGEGGVIQCWSNGVGYIQNNCFSGTVSATGENAVVGGVIGNMRALDCYNIINNNYYAAACGANKGVGQIEFVIEPDTTGSVGSGWAKVNYNGAAFGRDDDPGGVGADALAKSFTSAELTDGTLVRALNAGLNSSGDWIQGENQPAFGGKRHLLSITCSSLSTMNGVTAFVDGADILSGKTLTLTYSDGTIETVDALLAARDFIVSSDLVGKSFAASIVYNNHQLVFKLNVNTGSYAQDPDPTPSSDVKVSFTLLGDDAHGESGTTHTLRAGNLTTWITQTTITVASGSNVMTVLAKVLNQNSYSWTNDDEANNNTGNYIQSITTPAGVTLAEFTNGPNSGWMYTLNGSHPLLGVIEQTVADGDVIVFHYTDDYTNEEGSEKWNDTNSGSSASVAGATTKLTPKITAVGGVAAVTLSGDTLEEALDNAKENDNGAIVIEPEITGTATKVTAELPKASLTSMASETDADLIIETPVGNVTIPNAALDAIAAQASGSTVTVSLGTVDNTTLTAAQQKTVGTGTVYDISILSGGSHISTFGGGSITISLPYTMKNGETGENVIVWYLNDAGKLEQMTCTYDASTGLATFTTTHLSKYLVGYDAWTNPFGDVKSTDWFYNAVKYVSQNSFMGGTAATTFEPNTDMTRGMLVTVLYRLDGKPAVTGKNGFADVKSAQWYTDAVIWADANNIAGGYGGGLFGTEDIVTREQMAAILYNYAKYKGYDITASADLSAYTDAVSINSWSQSGMKWANAEGLVTGRTTTTIVPGGDASRAEVAEMLMRFVEKFVK
jgi:hypothetical protein